MPETSPGRRAATLAAAALALLAGMALQMQRAELLAPPLPELGVAFAAAVCSATALGLRRLQRGRSVAVAAFIAAVLLFGFASTELRARWRLADALDPALEGRDLLVTGTVASLPQRAPTGTRFVFDVESALLQQQPVALPARLRLSWYAGFDAEGLLGAAEEPIVAGQRWQLSVRLRAPHGSANPHGFDSELWLFEQNQRATGYVRSLPGAANRKLADAAAAPVERLRQRIREAIERRVADPAVAGVLAALAVGDQAAIERDDWELFRITGVAHLMSISGLHVTMFAWLAGALIGRAWRAMPGLPLRVGAPLAARWGGVVAAAAYALLAGWGVPAQRTVVMLAVVALLRSSALRWPAPAVLLAAALVVCLADPWALMQAGFWLSFCAVGLLMLSEHATPPQAEQGWWRRVRAVVGAALRTQAVATAGLAPLSLLFFGQLSLVGFGANLVAIPLVTLLITPLALLGVLLPPLWSLAALVVQGLMALLGWAAAVPWATWSAAAAPAWAAVAGLFGGWLIVAPLPWRLRLLGVPLLLPLASPHVPRPAEGRFEVVAVDVGQGTAVLVRTRQHLLVYDTGARWSPDSDAGSRLLLPLLRARGERQIHRLVLSHRDSDHVGGAEALLRHAGVRSMSSSLEPGHPLLQGMVPHEPCAAGQRWQWDGVQFELLHPLPGAIAPGLKPNTLSCVLRVQESGAAARSLLLTGDIEAAQEAALAQRAGAALRSTALLVPHHGSRTSSSAAFIDAVAPEVAIVQAGYRSRFGHPASDVVQRYVERGITVVRSDRCGAWLWQADGTQECQRLSAARYWHHRPGPIPAAQGSCDDTNPHRREPCRSTSR